MTRPRVLVVRSGGAAFGRRVEGAEVVERVSHRIEPLPVAAGDIPDGCDAAVFTSRTAVERVFGDADLSARLRASLGEGGVVAVGDATAEALRSFGIPAASVAEGSGAALLDAMPSDLSGRTILFPRAEDAAGEVAGGLRARGARVHEVIAYRKRALPRDATLSGEILEHPFRAYFPTAPSAARWLFDTVSPEAAEALRRLPAVALGPSTASALTGLGARSIVVTARAGFAAAAEALARLAEAP